MASKLERARQSTARLRARIRGGEPLRALSAFGAGTIVGTLEGKKIVPATISGLPVKPILAGLGYIVAASSAVGSTASHVMFGASNGVMGAYGYAAGNAGTLIAGIAGEDEDEDHDLG